MQPIKLQEDIVWTSSSLYFQTLPKFQLNAYFGSEYSRWISSRSKSNYPLTKSQQSLYRCQIGYPSTYRMPSTQQLNTANFPSLATMFWAMCWMESGRGNQCRAWPIVTKSNFSLNDSIQSFLSTYMFSLASRAFFLATLSIQSLISVPTLFWKWGASANKSWPVPVAISRYLFLFFNLLKHFSTNLIGYLGLKFSQLTPWVLNPKGSFSISIMNGWNLEHDQNWQIHISYLGNEVISK